MKIIFMGSSSFSIPALEALINSHHDIIGAVTKPPKPSGRGLIKKPTRVYETAIKHDIDTITPSNLSDEPFKKWLQSRIPDAIVVSAYGKLIPPYILTLPRYGCINIHPSLLPKYRGAAPIQRCLLKGDTKTAVTVMKLDEGMDTGPIIMQQTEMIDILDNAISLEDRLSRIGAELLLKSLSLLEQQAITPIPQNNDLAVLAPKISKEEGELDFNKSAVENHNTVRALISWPTAWTYYKGNQLQILSTEPLDEAPKQAPGTIIESNKNGIHTATGKGTLLIKYVKPNSGKPMSAFDFAIGRGLKSGDMFKK